MTQRINWLWLYLGVMRKLARQHVTEKTDHQGLHGCNVTVERREPSFKGFCLTFCPLESCSVSLLPYC